MNLMKYDWSESYQKMSFETAPLSYIIINNLGGIRRNREMFGGKQVGDLRQDGC